MAERGRVSVYRGHKPSCRAVVRSDGKEFLSRKARDAGKPCGIRAAHRRMANRGSGSSQPSGPSHNWASLEVLDGVGRPV